MISMLGHAGHKAAALAGMAVVAVAMLGGPVFAAPPGTETAPAGFSTYDTDEGALNSLMVPILPLIGNGPGSTTSIDQAGVGNSAYAGIDGSGSLALTQQSGAGNRSVQAINGDSSALLLVEGGYDNSVAQVANGDRDFQLVGVSGHNNQVAYVQVGDDLKGALDVTNSVNTTVLAFQTPQSGHFMMPSGISGLKNSVVVVVPGRMYVLPKK